MRISRKSLKWVFQRGGRTREDVYVYGKELYVIMYDGKSKNYYKLKIPKL